MKNWITVWVLSIFVLTAMETSVTFAAVSATGGNSTNDIDGYRIHVFTNSGSLIVAGEGAVDVLVVAGGGGGGGTIGGGGGGGLIYSNGYAVFPGSMTVTVGAGGAAGLNGNRGLVGSNSVFGPLTAVGGGGGGGWDAAAGLAGGSGGGGANSYSGGAGTTNQGYTGGSSAANGGGGGGGASALGTNATSSLGGRGGDGRGFDISGVLTYYSGGGGGGARTANATGGGGGLGGGGGGATSGVGSNAVPNTGGGGGGGSYDGGYRAGGKGGSGIVIVRYVLLNDLSVVASGATGIGEFSATLNGQVQSTGKAENPYVYFCWDFTDAGTNSGTSVWANVAFMGTNWGVGDSFSTNLTGLLSGSNYAYRCYATNSTGSVWSDEVRTFVPVAFSATGGNATKDIDGYRIHVFTNNGSLIVAGEGTVEVLVVAGGGGGGGTIGGGGGGGGLIYSNGYAVFPGTMTVTVGAGGAAGPGGGRGGNGNPSAFGTMSASGGGGGGGWEAGSGLAGASGGGSANSQAAGGTINTANK